MPFCGCCLSKVSDIILTVLVNLYQVHILCITSISVFACDINTKVYMHFSVNVSCATADL